MDKNTATEALIEAVKQRKEIDSDIRTVVGYLRQEGMPWSEVALYLGISKQGAQQNYGPKIQTAPAPVVVDDVWTQADVSGPSVTPSALADVDDDAEETGPEYRPEAECIEPSKQTLTFIARAEKAGLTAKMEITPALKDEPRHQLTVVVEDPKDPSHYLYWIQTASVFAWSSQKPSHHLRYTTGTRDPAGKQVRQSDATRLLATLAGK